jgi:hypothetical protein
VEVLLPGPITDRGDVTRACGIHPLGCQLKIVLLGVVERPAEREKLTDDLPPFVLRINPGLSGSNEIFTHDS